jgi:hypothetical protein
MDDQHVQPSTVQDIRRTRWHGLHRLGGERWLCLIMVILRVGCGWISVQPILSSSLSIEAFEELGQIRRAPVDMTIFIQPDFLDARYPMGLLRT